MDRIFALLRVLIFLPTCTCVNPGLKIRITQNGLNYGMYPYCTHKINSKIRVCVKQGTQVGIQNVLTTVTMG